MKTKTLIFTIVAIIYSLTASAQYGGMYGGGMYGGGMYGGGMYGGGMGRPLPTATPQDEEIDFLGAVGYFEISVEDALKKIKAKGDKAASVERIIEEYNADYIGLMISNRAELDVLEFASENLKALEGNVEQSRAEAKRIGDAARVVRPLLVEFHTKLDDSMAEILTGKTLKRWRKFHEGRCSERRFNLEAAKENEASKDKHTKGTPQNEDHSGKRRN